MKLSELKVNQSARILKVDILDSNLKIHILEMGMTKGTTIKILNIAPLGDPISIAIRGYELAIRKEDANHILVEVIS